LYNPVKDTILNIYKAKPNTVAKLLGMRVPSTLKLKHYITTLDTFKLVVEAYKPTQDELLNVLTRCLNISPSGDEVFEYVCNLIDGTQEELEDIVFKVREFGEPNISLLYETLDHLE